MGELFWTIPFLTHFVSLFLPLSIPQCLYLSLNYSSTTHCPLSLSFTPTHKLCSHAPVPSLGHHFHAPVCSLSHLCCSFCPALPLSSAGAVRASSIFPILSVILLFMGGLCIAASEFYKTRHNIILSAGIFFVSAGKGMHRAGCPRGGLQGSGGCPARTPAGAQLPRQECVHFPALISLIWAESSITRMPLHPAC